MKNIKRRDNFYTINEDGCKEAKLNLNTIKLARNYGKFLNWSKQLELKAAQEERFEDAIKWRDVPENGIIHIYLDMDNNWKVLY
jgi:hypothetical protein